MAKRKKKLTFKDWTWDTADIKELDALVDKLCGYGARVAIECVTRDSAELMLCPPRNGEKGWVISFQLRCDGMADDAADDTIVDEATVLLRTLIVETDDWFKGDDEDKRKQFNAFKAEVMAALAELARRILHRRVGTWVARRQNAGRIDGEAGWGMMAWRYVGDPELRNRDVVILNTNYRPTLARRIRMAWFPRWLMGRGHQPLLDGPTLVDFRGRARPAK